MKKAVFAIQVFVLMALFPVYLIVELNHETETLAVNNPSSEFTERPKENNIQPISGSNGKGVSFLLFETKG